MVDLRRSCPPVYDQGDLGSCTANALAAAHQFDQFNQKLITFTPSRLFIYYNERSIEGTVASDAGAEIHDGIKSIATQGVCPESIWPYDISQFSELPSTDAYMEAAMYKALSYEQLEQTLASLKDCLASGSPFVFGFTVYESFESAEVAATGIVPTPTADEAVLGGHAVLCVGYDDSQQRFIVRNSWGEAWGDKGYCYMPYLILTSYLMSDDFWTIRTVQ